jgi:hypothetical protein
MVVTPPLSGNGVVRRRTLRQGIVTRRASPDMLIHRRDHPLNFAKPSQAKL